MRGDDQQQFSVFSYVAPEDRVPADHPLRPIRRAVDEVLQAMSRRMDRKPEAVSRLLRGEGSNPTLDTLVDLADALGLELDIRIKRQPRKPASSYSPLKVHATV